MFGMRLSGMRLGLLGSLTTPEAAPVPIMSSVIADFWRTDFSDNRHFCFENYTFHATDEAYIIEGNRIYKSRVC